MASDIVAKMKATPRRAAIAAVFSVGAIGQTAVVTLSPSASIGGALLASLLWIVALIEWHIIDHH
jgi:hypothetical protein